jgi:hypothetical protein
VALQNTIRRFKYFQPKECSQIRQGVNYNHIGNEVQISPVFNWIPSLGVTSPRSHIGKRWRLVFCFMLRQFYPGWKRPRHLFGMRPDGHQTHFDMVTMFLPVVRSFLKCLEEVGLDRDVQRVWVAAWERHDRQAVVVTWFLIPHRRQLGLVCICHRGTACLSTCQHLHSCHELVQHFLAQKQQVHYERTLHRTAFTIRGQKVDWFLVTEIWNSQTKTVETHLSK